MLKGTFGLAKNTEQQSEAREMLRSDLVKAPRAGHCKCVSETRNPAAAWSPPSSMQPHPSQLVLNLTTKLVKQLG